MVTPANTGIVFYPRPQRCYLGHTEVVYDRDQYNAFGGFNFKPFNIFGKRIHREEASEKHALRSPRAGFIKFPILFDANEIQPVDRFIDRVKGRFRLQTCVTGANELVSRSEVFQIPFPYSWSPALTAYWLKKQHEKGNPYVGEPIVMGNASLSDIDLAVKSEISHLLVYSGLITVGFSLVTGMMPMMGL